MKDKNIEFRLVGIKTDQFATFELKESNVVPEGIKTEISYGISPKNRLIACGCDFEFEFNKKPLLKLHLICEFEVKAKSWQSFKQDSTLTLNKEILRHFAVITIGTARGVLHAKTENTEYNKYFLPTINVEALVKKDATFKLD